MRTMILAMLSTSSLSAFSASVTQSRLDRLAAAQPARSAAPSQGSQNPAQAAPTGRGGASAPPGQILPRGSLLDMSV